MAGSATSKDVVAREMGPVQRGFWFVAIGALIYAGAYGISERLVYRTGDSNPFFKMATVERSEFDWVILGASHAMPLDFGDFNAFMQDETGFAILNLASPGTGPLYNRFVLEQFFRDLRAHNVLYVLDSFGFYNRAWNEDRFADSKLLSRTPFDPRLARSLLHYTVAEDVDPRALLDYVSGFSKINNRDRFKLDMWEGEAQFQRSHRPSSAADAKRIAYLYPGQDQDSRILARYLEEFDGILALAARNRAAITVIKPPVPAQYYRKLPNEASFDAAIVDLLVRRGVVFRDYSHVIPEPRLYLDTDHLNQEGLMSFFVRSLKPMLLGVNSSP